MTRPASARASLAGSLLAACSAAAPTAAPPPPVAVVPVVTPVPVGSACVAGPAASAAPAASSVSMENPDVETRRRFFPEALSARDAPASKSRPGAVVVLFAPPGSIAEEEPGLVSLESVRFQPVACLWQGKVVAGSKCGQVMPARARVRVTGHLQADLEVTRSTRPFVDQAGGTTYPAPFEPECCFYNGCRGRTVPYRPVAAGGQSVLFTTRTLFAVWPPDADVMLEPLAPELADALSPDDVRELAAAAGGEVTPVQNFEVLGARGVTLTLPASRRGPASGHDEQLFWRTASGWRLHPPKAGLHRRMVLAATDLDGDRRPEFYLLDRWSNDFDFSVWSAGAAQPIHSFGCGNI